MAKIRVDVDGLQDNYQSLGLRTAEMQDLIARLNAILERIDSSWEGDASRAFIEMMRGYRLRAEGVLKVVQAHRDYIGKASAKFSAADARCADVIRNSF